MSKYKGDHVVAVQEPVQDFMPADQVLKRARKDSPKRVVVIFIDDNNELTVRSSNLRFADTICDIVQAQHHMMDLVKEHGSQ